MKFNSIQDCVGKIISEQPYVKILNEPKYEEYQLIPGMVNGRWTCLAQVNESLCYIELKIIEQQS